MEEKSVNEIKEEIKRKNTSINKEKTLDKLCKIQKLIKKESALKELCKSYIYYLINNKIFFS